MSNEITYTSFILLWIVMNIYMIVQGNRINNQLVSIEAYDQQIEWWKFPLITWAIMCIWTCLEVLVQ